ncbi:hypothetical protein FGE05_15020 [Pseudomonas sp. ICMP22404]|nr:hypothetical protein FGE05_15020 [Pseudomonas sp. ICMP22404]
MLPQVCGLTDWHQGLPAMAAAHSIQVHADPPLSRASPLPQWWHPTSAHHAPRLYSPAFRSLPEVLL